MKQKLLLLTLSMISIAMLLSGCALKREDAEPPSTELSEVAKTTTLESENFYVWSDNTFKPSVISHYTFRGDETDSISYPERIIWYSELDEEAIPTVYAGDAIVYCSGGVMPEEFKWERFEDLGYTVGITDLEKLPSGKYALSLDTTDEHIYDDSDISVELSEYDDVSSVIVDKIGGVTVSEDCIDESGTILGLKKGAAYDIEYYVGTYMKEMTATATYHAFSSMEVIYSVNYDFLQSDIAIIQIPDGLKTGYYLLGGEMFFRYVAGDSYDGSTDFNVPNDTEQDVAEETETPETTEKDRSFDPEESVVEETESETELEDTETSDAAYTRHSEQMQIADLSGQQSIIISFQFAEGTEWTDDPIDKVMIKDADGNILFDLSNAAEYEDISHEWDPATDSFIIEIPNKEDTNLSNLQIDFDASDSYKSLSATASEANE